MTGRGFTLIETILVLAIVSTAAGLALASYRPQPNAEFLAKKIKATIRQARAEAQSSMTPQVVIINSEGRTFGIQGKKAHTIPDNVAVSGSTSTVRVDTFGIAETAIITISDTTKTFTIKTDPVTGAVLQ